MIGQTISHYRITEKIGEGGMGEVYRATDTRLNREVALKVLPEAFAGDSPRIGRFSREAQVLASLSHPNIASIYGLEEANGTKALAMELVEGEDLSERIARGPIPLEEALPIALQIAESLEAAHGFEGSEFDAAISPDGRFVAFVADRDGPFEVFVGQIGAGQLLAPPQPLPGRFGVAFRWC